jgi:ATP-dependent DNA helicase DinG
VFDDDEKDISFLLSDDMIYKILGEGGTLSKRIPGYEVRQSQIDGVLAIKHSLEDEKNFILEGPCGYGKSATYLIPSILYSIATNARVIIATAGITLQEQIYNKDIPAVIGAIEEAAGEKVSYAYLKGRQNFICLRKIQELEFDMKNKISNIEYKDEKLKILSWATNTKTGDQSELDYVPEYDVWKEVSCTDSNECQGNNCPLNKSCFYQKRKLRAKVAGVVVCNYHVLFSDITIGKNPDTGEGVLLGKYKVVVCDEAHEMPKIARDFMEKKISYYTFTNIQRKITHVNNKYKDLVDTSKFHTDLLIENAADYFKKLTDTYRFKNDDGVKMIKDTPIEYEGFEKAVREFGNNVWNVREDICVAGEEAELRGCGIEGEKKLSLCSELDSIVNRVEEALAALELICTQESEDNCYWFEFENNSLLSMHAKPIRVDDFLRDNIFGEGQMTGIITSATLSVNDSFDYIRTELGIDEADEMIAPSPFNMKDQQLWYLPSTAIEGNSREFSPNMIKNLVELIEATKGGALCLFTSNYNMNMAAAELERRLPCYTMLKQGRMPRNLLLKYFAEDTNSVLLGTKSFFTGVDIEGSSLRCLVVDKLPFASPNDPVMSILANQPNGFFKYYIPDMVITLKQAVGRGVRDISDKCVVAIMDNRMATARYRYSVAKSFNYEKTSTRDIEDVKKFIDEYMAQFKVDEPEFPNWDDDIPF